MKTINELLLDLNKENKIEINTINVETPEIVTLEEEKIEIETLN